MDKLVYDTEGYMLRRPNPPEKLYIPSYYTNMKENAKAKEALHYDSIAAYNTELLYKLTCDIKYKHKSKEFLLAWSDTLKKVTGSDRCSDSYLVFVFKGQKFLHAYDFLTNRQWSTISYKFLSWIYDVYLPSCSKISDRLNNLGTWGLYGCILSYHISKDKNMVYEYLDSFVKHVGRSVMDNEFWPENFRNNSGLQYWCFNLMPIIGVISLIERHYFNSVETEKFYKLISDVVDKFYSYLVHPECWTYKKSDNKILRYITQLLYPSADYFIVPLKESAVIFEVLSKYFKTDRWDNITKKYLPITESKIFAYSTCMLKNNIL